MKYSTPVNEIRNRMEAVAGKQPHSQSMVTEVNRLRQALEGLESLAEKRDPTETEGKHATRVAQGAKQLSDLIDRVEKNIMALLGDGATRICNEIDARAPLKEDAYAVELRSVVRGMEKKDAVVLLRDAVEKGDAATVAALTNVPGIITGLDDEYASRMRETYREKHAPEAHQARNVLFEVESAAAVAVKTAREAAQKAVDPSYIREIQRAAAEAQRAQATFSEAVQ